MIVDKFEEVRANMDLFNMGRYTESIFVGGLSAEPRSAIKLFKLSSLLEAIEVGREQINTMDLGLKVF